MSSLIPSDPLRTDWFHGCGFSLVFPGCQYATDVTSFGPADDRSPEMCHRGKSEAKSWPHFHFILFVPAAVY